MVSRCLSIFSSHQIRLCQLLDVVHHAVQVPLRVDLGASSVIQACPAWQLNFYSNHCGDLSLTIGFAAIQLRAEIKKLSIQPFCGSLELFEFK
jgi:hypothetical protein